MKRSEIWYINLDPTVGAEIKKTRPAVVVNDDTLGILPLRIIVPITDWKNHYENTAWMLKLESNQNNHLSKTSAADCFQIRSLSKERFVKKIGTLNKEEMKEIENILATILNINN